MRLRCLKLQIIHNISRSVRPGAFARPPEVRNGMFILVSSPGHEFCQGNRLE